MIYLIHFLCQCVVLNKYLYIRALKSTKLSIRRETFVGSGSLAYMFNNGVSEYIFEALNSTSNFIWFSILKYMLIHLNSTRFVTW